MHILSFDIEEWYIEKQFSQGRTKKYKEFDSYLNKILDVLDENELKATFFCVGKIAKYFPEVIRRIAVRGHEVGCHSNEHLWLTKMTPNEMLKDTQAAVSALEDIWGEKVISYRAPAFSIGEHNKWTFEILAECGIKRDASIYPAVRDFGGFASFPSDSPVLVAYNGIQMKEFPIALTHLLGKDFAYSGGGYFRFFPLCYIRYKMSKSPYSIAYFHIGDLIHHKDGLMSRTEYETYFKEKGTLINRYKRYVKSTLGTKYAFAKMATLLKEYQFVNLQHADALIDWNHTPIVHL